MQWKHPGSPTPKKSTSVSSAGKVMVSIFWDCYDGRLSSGRLNNKWCILCSKINAAASGDCEEKKRKVDQGPVVQSVVSLTSSLRVISLTVLADSIYNILIFFAEKM